MIFVAVLGLLILCCNGIYCWWKAVFRYTRLADFSWNKRIFKTDKYVWCCWTL